MGERNEGKRSQMAISSRITQTRRAYVSTGTIGSDMQLIL